MFSIIEIFERLTAKSASIYYFKFSVSNLFKKKDDSGIAQITSIESTESDGYYLDHCRSARSARCTHD